MTNPTVNEVLDRIEAAVCRLNETGAPFEPATVLGIIRAERQPMYVPRQRVENKEEADV